MKSDGRPNGEPCGRLMLSLGTVLTLFALSTGYGLYRIDAIGANIQEIAEGHIPLTELITEIESHQLGQSVLLERALRLGEGMAESAQDRRRFEETSEEYLSYAGKVGEALRKGEKLAGQAAQTALTEATRTSFEDVGRRLRKIAQEHQDIDHHANEVFKLLHQGQPSEAHALLDTLEREEGELDHALETLLMQIEGLTEQAVSSAERSEKQAYLWMLIFAGFAFSAIPAAWHAARNSRP